MVILGIIGRMGFLVVFIGNIVEYVIDKINCDVFVFKFNGYVSFFDL